MGHVAANALVYEQEMRTYHVVCGLVSDAPGGSWSELYDPQIDARLTGGHLVPPTYAVLFQEVGCGTPASRALAKCPTLARMIH